VHCELATGYHLFVLQFFLLCGLCARNRGDDFPETYWHQLEKMFEFVAALAEGGRVPVFGDCDDGYVVDLDGNPGDARVLLAVGGAIFDRADFMALSGGVNEPAFWLLGEDRCRQIENDRVEPLATHLASRAFRDSGYYILQCGHRESRDRISATFDCGALGFGTIAAHGHADALSFTLRVGGRDVLVDPGTYDYFSFREWRDYFRSTRAHNTISIDGREQSDANGLFLWGRRAHARCLLWENSGIRTIVIGEHDGFQGCSNPATHRRTLCLDAKSSELEILDEICAARPCQVQFQLHFSESCDVEAMPENRFRVELGGQTVFVHCDARLGVSLARGQTSPILGWVSRTYHQKSPATTLIGVCSIDGSVELRTRIVVCPARRALEDAMDHQRFTNYGRRPMAATGQKNASLSRRP
jgi:hypothetical protein